MQIPKSKPIPLYSLTKFPDDSMYPFSLLQSVNLFYAMLVVTESIYFLKSSYKVFLEGNNDFISNIKLDLYGLLKPFLREGEKKEENKWNY